jgi:murein L,D-transpeptidase YafK
MARNAAKQALISALGVALLLTVASTPLNARRHPTHAAPTSNAASTKPSAAPQTIATERLLAQVFEALDQHKMDLALQRVDALIAARPNYRLAHLIRGDLLLARTRPISGFASGVRAPGDKVEDLRAEALARLRAMRERPKAEQVPRYLLQLRPNQKHALVVDTKRSRLYVYENQRGRLQFVTDYYVTIGKQGAAKMREGDQKTPLGVYHVTANLPRAKLTDFYGSGAFPINYPNEWDKRQGRNGHGIWLHGTPSDTYARPPRASDGCIVLSNPDLEALGLGLQVGLTTVIIAEEIQWSTADAHESERQTLAQALESWRADWESLNTDRYLQHYASRFTSGDQDLRAWAAQKRKVNAGKEWVKIGTSDVSMFRNPGKDDFVVVEFDQLYRSSNLSNSMRKRQYWIREDNRWKIVYEGAA